MPERIYTNRIDGQQRIHVEINAAEICDILDDFTPAADAFDSTKELHRLLRESLAVFSPNLAEMYEAADAPADGAPTGASAPNVAAGKAYRKLRATLAAFADVLDDSDRGPWGRSVGAAMAELETALDAPPTPVRAPDVEADNAQLRQRLDRVIEHRNQIEAALREVLDQFSDWPAGGTLWPEAGVVAKVSAEEWDRWDAVIAPADEPGPADTTPPSEPGHATVTIAIHAPDQANADQWAETIRDLVQNEHGQHMRLNIRITPKESK